MGIFDQKVFCTMSSYYKIVNPFMEGLWAFVGGGAILGIRTRLGRMTRLRQLRQPQLRCRHPLYERWTRY